MNNPLVSVITPAYNAEQHIAETIQSVLDQTYPHWEMLVVDDGSTDKTADIVAQFNDPRVKLIQIEHSGLAAVARNNALQAATGSHLAFLDADDVWRFDKLEKQIEYLECVPDVALCFTNAWRLINAKKTEEPIVTRTDLPGQRLMFQILCQGNPITNSSVVVRRSVVDGYGGFDENPRLRGTEDYELWLRLSASHEFGFIDEPLLWYRVRPDSVSRDRPTMIMGKIIALEKARARHPQLFAELGTDGKRCLARAMLNYAEALSNERRPGAALRWVGMVCLRYPYLCVRDFAIMVQMMRLLVGRRGRELGRSVKKRLSARQA